MSLTGATAFVENTRRPFATQLKATNENNIVGEQSRRGFVQSLGLASMTVMAPPAFAEETESESVSTIILSPNLRSMKRAEKQLSKMEFYAVENDYENLKLAIRNAPFSEIRKNSYALIKEYAGRSDEQAKLNSSYVAFIAALEKMDSTASLGLRGRKLESDEMLKCFQATSVALNNWIAVATEVESSA